jgi:hypothetical protein
MAAGMNWGIFSLLAVVVTVLGGVAAFFIYLARRSARTPLISTSRLQGRGAAVFGCSDLNKQLGLGPIRPLGQTGNRFSPVAYRNGAPPVVPGTTHSTL